MDSSLLNLLDLHNLNQKYQVVHPQQLCNNRDIDLAFLRTIGKPLLIAGDSDPHGPQQYQYWLSLIKELKVTGHVLTSDLKSFFEPNSFVYFPRWLLTQLLQKNYQTANKSFRFSFLSSQARFHRLYFFQQAKPYLTQDDCFAVYATNRDNQDAFVIKDSMQHLGHVADVYAEVPYFSERVTERVPDFLESVTKNQLVQFTNQHVAYNAMINITGETDARDDIVFFSEKTWKPIQSRCLFFTLGNSDSDRLLAQLGFQIFQQRDQDLTLLDRISYIKTAIKEWDLAKCQQLYQDHIELVQHNYNRLHSQDLQKLFKSYLQERLEL
jgi:hypothetical protein